MRHAHHRFYLSAFFLDFAVSCGFTAIPFFVFHELGGGARMSGTIGAVQSLFYGMTCLLTAGVVMRTRGGLRWAVAGSLGYGIALPLATLFREPVAFTVMTVIACMLMALYWPAMQAWVGSEPNPAVRAKRIGVFNIWWSAGLAGAPLIAGPLYEVDYHWPFVLVFFTSIVAMALTMTLPRADAHHASIEGNVDQAKHYAASEAHLWCGWCANFMGWAMVGVMRSVFPKRVDELVNSGELVVGFGTFAWERLDWGAATQYSWLMTFMYVVRAASSFGLGSWQGWHHRFSVLVWSQIVAAVAFCVLGVTKSLSVMVLCAIAVGVSGAVTFFASLFYSVANSEKRHRRAAIHEATVGLGSFSGAMLFGELAGRFGTTWPFLYTPIFISAGIALQYFLLKAGSRRTAL